MVRIKNRLDPCYDSALSSGYRDVMINICIKTPETTSLRVQHHVAELQLILREVYECCTTPGTHDAVSQAPRLHNVLHKMAQVHVGARQPAHAVQLTQGWHLCGGDTKSVCVDVT